MQTDLARFQVFLESMCVAGAERVRAADVFPRPRALPTSAYDLLCFGDTIFAFDADGAYMGTVIGEQFLVPTPSTRQKMEKMEYAIFFLDGVTETNTRRLRAALAGVNQSFEEDKMTIGAAAYSGSPKNGRAAVRVLSDLSVMVYGCINPRKMTGLKLAGYKVVLEEEVVDTMKRWNYEGRM